VQKAKFYIPGAVSSMRDKRCDCDRHKEILFLFLVLKKALVVIRRIRAPL